MPVYWSKYGKRFFEECLSALFDIILIIVVESITLLSLSFNTCWKVLPSVDLGDQIVAI